MSFDRNYAAVIVEEELFSELSNSGEESDQQKTDKKGALPKKNYRHKL